MQDPGGTQGTGNSGSCGILSHGTDVPKGQEDWKLGQIAQLNFKERKAIFL